MLLPFQLNGLNLDSATAVAVVTGTALTESQVVAGGQTIVITLTNDTWVTATFDAQRQNIIDGLDSAQSETLGWNAEVRDKEVVTAVVRTSDTVVTITLSASPAYDVTANEGITPTIPATALTGGVELTGTPTIDITAAVAVALPGYHAVTFKSKANDILFSGASGRQILFEARERPKIIGYILLTDGARLLFENDLLVLREESE